MDLKPLIRKAKHQGISTDGTGGYSRHVLVCTGPECCAEDDGQKTWKHLVKQVRALKEKGILIRASRVACFGFCRGGPLMVVYPEGTWYGGVTPTVCERIVQEHLAKGNAVTEFAFACNPMAIPKETQTEDA